MGSLSAQLAQSAGSHHKEWLDLRDSSPRPDAGAHLGA